MNPYKLSYKIHKNKKRWLLFFPVLGMNHTSLLKISNYYKKEGYSTILFDYPVFSHKLSFEDWDSFCHKLNDILVKEKIYTIDIISFCSGGCIALRFYQLYASTIRKIIFFNFFSPRYVNIKWRFIYFMGYVSYYSVKVIEYLGFKSRKDSVFVNYDKMRPPVPTFNIVKKCIKSIGFLSYLSLWGKARRYNPSINESKVPSLVILSENEKFMSLNKLFKDISKNNFIKTTVIKGSNHPYTSKELNQAFEYSLSFIQ